MDISVIIPTRNRSAWLPKCLTHLEQQTYPAARFELIVADAGSTDDTASIISRFATGSPVRTRLIRVEGPDYGAACNRALSESDGRIVLFLADDELASPRLIEIHVETQERREERGVVTGAIHPHPQLRPGTLTRLDLDEGPEPARDQGVRPYLGAQPSNASIPRRILEQVGGISEDPRYRMLEHVELAYRLHGEGIDATYVPDARSYPWQAAQLDRERERHYHIGYSCYHLERLMGSRGILQRFRVRHSRLETLTARLLVPRYVRAIRRRGAESLPFAGPLYRRVLAHDRNRGYDDAGHDRARCSPEPVEPVEAGGPVVDGVFR